MAFMDDEQIEAALSIACCVCGMAAGEECVHPVSGKPWLEERGYPVHLRRCEP